MRITEVDSLWKKLYNEERKNGRIMLNIIAHLMLEEQGRRFTVKESSPIKKGKEK
jgi:hypothetical protein